MNIVRKITRKIDNKITSFRTVREGSNAAVAFKTEILSVFVRNEARHWKLIHDAKLGYLNKHYGNLVDKYVRREGETKKSAPTVWTMWWQGEEQMPPIVKACIRSMHRHVSENVKIVLLTKDNYADYVKIPGYILDKVEKKLITLTHLSDIIRTALLAEYGGMWLDSTLYVTKDIPDEMVTRGFFSTSTKFAYGCASDCMWSSFAIGGGNIVFDFMKEFLYTYWKEHNCFLDYFSIDYGLRMFWDKSPVFRQEVEKYSVFIEHIHSLTWKLNEAYDAKVLDEMAADSMFFKLTYKGDWKPQINGKQTFYGHFITENE